MRPKIMIYGNAENFRNYQFAVEATGGIPCFGGRPEVCDALLLPGGGDMESWRYGQPNIACRGIEPERDVWELELLDLFTGWKRPVLGICRGMQTINVFFGGTLMQDISGHSQIDGADRIHAVRAVRPFSSFNFAYHLYGLECLVNSAHHQCVDALGAGLYAAQRAQDDTIEAIYHQSLPVWGVQWHPERLPYAMSTQGTVNGSLVFQAFLQQI